MPRVAASAVVLSLALVAAFTLAPFTRDVAAASSDSTIGYDVSWPQCGGAYPAGSAFGIVGVNKGIVFSPNPCLASEISWAGGARTALYANTGNPGPALSKHWPLGQTSPRFCDAANPDTADCAFDYGYNAAADSYADAVAAFSSLGITVSPSASAWWLDVETGNSWRSDVLLNTAALAGEVEYLTSAGVGTIGFYSTQYQWNVITGGTSDFAAHPSWVAGAPDEQAALSNCAGAGFTGGGVALAQFPSGGFDANVRCGEAPTLTSILVSPGSTSVPAGQSVQFTATGYDQFGAAMSPQPSVAWSVSGGGTISSGGLFTAGTSAGGPYLVTASSGGVSGNANVTVTAAPAPDFALAVSPSSRSIHRGQTATWTVTITARNGFTGPVSLRLGGQPAGSTVTFKPSPASTSATLTVKTSSSSPRGTFRLTMTGTAHGRTHTATTSLTVTK